MTETVGMATQRVQAARKLGCQPDHLHQVLTIRQPTFPPKNTPRYFSAITLTLNFS